MGNWLPSFSANPSDEDLAYYENKDKKQENDDSDDHVLRDCKAANVVNTINFLEKIGVDVKDLKHMIVDLLKKQNQTLPSDTYEALQHTLKTHGSYSDVQLAIKNLVHERKIAIMVDFADDLGGSNVDAISKSITGVMRAAGAGATRTIIEAFLKGIKEVDFYKQECTTEAKRGLTLGIIDIIHNTGETILFEIVQVEVKMIERVDISVYYARASMHLRNFMIEKSIDDLVCAGDKQLLGFLSKNGVDVTEITKLMGYLLEKKHNDNDISSALRDKLCLDQPFKVPFILNNELRNHPDVIRHDLKLGHEDGDKETFYGAMERILADMSLGDLSKSFAALPEEKQKTFYKSFSPFGTIVKKLLEGIQKVNFFEKSCVCETNGYLDRQIGITNITNIIDRENYDAIIGFEFAAIAFKMLSKKKDGKLVFIGGPKIQVEVHAIYSRGSIKLSDFIPNEKKREEVLHAVDLKFKSNT